MVSNLSIIFMVISLLISILMPIILVINFYKKERFSLMAVLIGAIVFLVSQVATRIPLLSYFSTQDWYRNLSSNVAVMAVFLGLTAGIFEEVARFIAMKYFMKDKLEWKNGLAFGIGHGGIEAIVIVGMTLINNIVLSFMINAGIFEAAVASQLPPEAIAQVKASLVNTSPLYFLAGGYERIMTMAIQIALSIMVLYAVKLKKPVFLLYAILLHGIVDALAVILANRGLNIWVAEIYVTVCAALALVYIIKSRGKLTASIPYQKI